MFKLSPVLKYSDPHHWRNYVGMSEEHFYILKAEGHIPLTVGSFLDVQRSIIEGRKRERQATRSDDHSTTLRSEETVLGLKLEDCMEGEVFTIKGSAEPTTITLPVRSGFVAKLIDDCVEATQEISAKAMGVAKEAFIPQAGRVESGDIYSFQNKAVTAQEMRERVDQMMADMRKRTDRELEQEKFRSNVRATLWSDKDREMYELGKKKDGR